MKISIITTTCENAKNLDGCIKSVLMQTYNKLEFIVVSYGSNSCSDEKRLAYPNNVIFKDYQGDKGLNGALNYGITQSTGDVVCILACGDQLIDKSTLQNIVNAFKKSKANVVYGKGLFKDGRDILDMLRTFGSRPFKKAHMPFGKIPLHTSIYIKRNLLKALGYLSGQYPIASEYELYLRLFMHADIKPYFLDEFVVRIFMERMLPSPIKEENNKQKTTRIKLVPSKKSMV